ncbi:MAG: filamentous hemagglutinin N-terminal domain-containing protein, partial [Nitrospirae bacterium YQR-1]
ESSISNIIARVTEGGSSYIDGMISSAISGANLYFINPSGVVFGKNASLDIKGSFYVSTADYLKLSDGGKFNATNPSDTVLTVATPSAFGFLTSNPTGVSIEGSFLEVAEGKGITLVAGGIDIKNGYLYAPGGQINLAAVASAGEAAITSSGISVDAFSNFGDINISHTDSTRQTRNGNAIGNLDVSSTIAGAGNIYISGGKFITDGGQVCADTYGGGNGGGININVTGAISVTSGSQITSNTSSSGKAGDITITTESLTLTGNSLIGASALEDSTGDAGNVSIKASSTVNLSGHYYNNGVDSSSGIYTHRIASGTGASAGCLMGVSACRV